MGPALWGHPWGAVGRMAEKVTGRGGRTESRGEGKGGRAPSQAALGKRPALSPGVKLQQRTAWGTDHRAAAKTRALAFISTFAQWPH